MKNKFDVTQANPLSIIIWTNYKSRKTINF